jgi:predicted PurR-regulated permease PerM
VIHKLEYFLNARIIGSRIRARAWELLMAMLVMEATFGLAGLIAAPIYYAYLKNELTAKELV